LLIQWYVLSMKKHLLIGGTLLALLLIGIGGWYATAETPKALVAEESVEKRLMLPATVEVADTPEKRTQGLSGRESVPDDYGMLFIFDENAKHGFWMKDMRAPIDIIWIAENSVIVHIEHEVEPSTYPNVFTPQAPALYVLETKAGYAKEHGWSEGMSVDLSLYQ